MTADTLSLTFAALADPTRRAILKRLAGGTANVKELSRPFDMSGLCAQRPPRHRGAARCRDAQCSLNTPTVVRHRNLAGVGWSQTVPRLVEHLEQRSMQWPS
jgi:DNA-binding transcriptional ArsR family regulator